MEGVRLQGRRTVPDAARQGRRRVPDPARRIRHHARVLGFLLLVLGGAALPLPASAQDAPSVRVFAAASLTEVVAALASRFEGARVEPSFGASSLLARQIRDGAPADVFLSASPEWIDFLADAGALAGEPIVLARNRLVCASSRSRAVALGAVHDPQALLQALGADGRVAIADEGVPAGEYARAALRTLGLLDRFEPHLVGLQDVRAVLNAVEQGEVAAGFVYATDARVAPVEVLFAFPPETHPPIAYQAAVVRTAPHPAEARRFLEYLRSETARTVLRDAGFAPPDPR